MCILDACGTRKRASGLLELELQTIVSLLCVCWQPNSYLWEEQQTHLSADPSLQAQFFDWHGNMLLIRIISLSKNFLMTYYMSGTLILVHFTDIDNSSEDMEGIAY